MAEKTFLTIELGLQTIHETTTKLINRGHNLNCFVDMVNKLREKNIKLELVGTFEDSIFDRIFREFSNYLYCNTYLSYYC